ncbi:MAG: hypothetical protein VX871_06930 [Pseudomonadota bacterium]|nr:hypothetical protein [Pseudomonadota bacterium]
MGEPHVISALVAKRAEIAGQIEHLQDRMRQLVVDLDNVDATIHLFDPTIELADIKSKVVPPRHQAFKGEVSRIVLTTLKNAKKPLTSADIAQRVMAERGLDTANKRLLRLMVKRTGACLRAHRLNGVVKSTDGPTQYKLWEICR